MGQSQLQALVLTCWRTLISDMSCSHFPSRSTNHLAVFSALSRAPPVTAAFIWNLSGEHICAELSHSAGRGEIAHSNGSIRQNLSQSASFRLLLLSSSVCRCVWNALIPHYLHFYMHNCRNCNSESPF